MLVAQGNLCCDWKEWSLGSWTGNIIYTWRKEMRDLNNWSSWRRTWWWSCLDLYVSMRGGSRRPPNWPPWLLSLPPLFSPLIFSEARQQKSLKHQILRAIHASAIPMNPTKQIKRSPFCSVHCPSELWRSKTQTCLHWFLSVVGDVSLFVM